MEGLPIGGRLARPLGDHRCRSHRRCGKRWRLYPTQRRVESRERKIRLFELHQRIVDRSAILAAEQEKAQHFRVSQRSAIEHFADGEKVAERLRHLLVVDVDEAVVHPKIRELLTRCRARLRDLVFMVRELQIHAAGVDVEMLTQNLGRHHRAFDMPAGTARPPGRGPTRLAGLGALPEHEIERVALGRIDLDTCPGTQIGKTFA